MKRADILAPLCIGAVAILLIAVAAIRSVDLFSPDAVSYLRVAQYYAQGRWDLAVNGYWGPLLSWLMIPFLSEADKGLSAARIVMALSAIIFLIASIRILFVLGLSRAQIAVGTALVSLFTVFWAVNMITPDLLMNGLFLGGLAVTLSASSSPRLHFAAGLLYGMAYLAKSVALPMTILVIVGLYGFRVLIRRLPARAALRATGLTLAGMLLLATPWIVIISLQQGAPTFSTSAAVAHSLVGPGEEFRTHPLFRDFDVPPDGRLTSWEDPSTLDYPEWSPLADSSMFRHQITVFVRNILRIVELVSGFDELGLGVVACVAGFLFHHPWRERFAQQPWRYSLLIVAPVSALYAPVFADEPRYYLLFYPLLVGSALAFFGELADVGRRRSESLRSSNLPAMLAVALVTLSFSAPFLPGVAIALTRGSPTPEFHVARGFSTQLQGAPEGPIAAVGQNDARHIAFYTAYLSGRAFYGTRMGEASVEDILDSGTAFILVTVDSAVDRTLAADDRFASFPALTGQIADYRLYHVMAE